MYVVVENGNIVALIDGAVSQAQAIKCATSGRFKAYPANAYDALKANALGIKPQSCKPEPPAVAGTAT
jgi:hypothetical protein